MPRVVRRLMPILVAVVLCSANSIAAQEYEAEKILKLISDFAEQLCPKVPLQGRENTFEISGQAKAELTGLLKKLSDLGFQGAAKYRQAEFEGFLQKDLLAATRDSTECKLKVTTLLSTKLLAAAIADPYRLPRSVREDFAAMALKGNEWKHHWVTRLNQPEDVQRVSAKRIIDWHKSVEDYITKTPSLGLTYLARFRIGRSSGTYPAGINTNLAGVWDLLHSDLDNIAVFMSER